MLSKLRHFLWLGSTGFGTIEGRGTVCVVDANALCVLTKLRNFLWLGSTGFGTIEGPCGAVCVVDANALCASLGTVLYSLH